LAPEVCLLESQVAVFLLVVQRKIELSTQYFTRKSRPCDITKKTVPLNPSNAEKSLAMVDGVLDSVFCILDDFLGFLLLVSNYLTGFFLKFASEAYG
jgi:hypothetical protein